MNQISTKRTQLSATNSSEISVLQEKNSVKETEIKRLLLDRSSIKEENDEQKNEIELLHAELSAFKDKNKVQKIEIELLHIKTNNLKEELTENEKNINEVKKESERISKVSEQHETNVISLSEEKLLLEKQNNKLKIYKKESHDLKKELETQKAWYEKEVETLTQYKNKKVIEDRERRKVEKKEKQKEKRSLGKLKKEKLEDLEVDNEFIKETPSNDSSCSSELTNEADYLLERNSLDISKLTTSTKTEFIFESSTSTNAVSIPSTNAVSIPSTNAVLIASTNAVLIASTNKTFSLVSSNYTPKTCESLKPDSTLLLAVNSMGDPDFSQNPQLKQLLSQIMAYRLIVRNKPLPAKLVIAVCGGTSQPASLESPDCEKFSHP